MENRGRPRKPRKELSRTEINCCYIPTGTITFVRYEDGGSEYSCTHGCKTGKRNSTQCSRLDVHNNPVQQFCTARDQP
ncbi:hypothetical protein HN935_03035 [archaeon]|nr:hypothetical protein [archaeon]